MSGFLFAIEAIESRIASYSCPRGIPGRVHSLRLRRCFHNHEQRLFGTLKAQQNQASTQFQSQSQSSSQAPHNSSDARFEEHSETVDIGTGSRDGDGVAPRSRRFKMSQNGDWISKRREIRELQPKQLPDTSESSVDILYTFPNSNSSLPMSENKAKAALFAALGTGDPHQVLRILIDLSKPRHLLPAETTWKGFNQFITSLPASTFSEVLRMLDPTHFISRMLELNREVSPAYAKVLKLPPVEKGGYNKFCMDFLKQIKWIVAQRRRANRPLSLSDLKYLLKCARRTGQDQIANEIWRTLTLGGNEVKPDLECYNHFLGVKCWADIENPLTRYRLRLALYNTVPRQWILPPKALQGHRLGPGGIKATVSQLFREMIDAGISGNEETFCYIMVALGREGDLAGIASILKRVWGIDVEGLGSSNLENPVKRYKLHSPLHPSEQLCFTIAHVYGINNDVPTALRLVDYVSGKYSIPITLNVWKELLEWTYVLSVPRRPRRLDDGTYDHSASAGQLPRQAIANLWKTMTSSPYNAIPTIQMYDRLISNLLSRQRFGEAQAHMENARRLYKNNLKHLGNQMFTVGTTSFATQSPIYDARTRELDLTELESRRHRQYIRKWTRLLLKRGNRYLKGNTEWAPRGIPYVVETWKLFLPHRLVNHTSTGSYKFWTGSTNENRFRQWKRRQDMAQKIERRLARDKRMKEEAGEDDYLAPNKILARRTRPHKWSWKGD
ncbi:hypothetical protein G7Y89_g9536 [Cudoniella acicularis]|uniref:Pentatricopeptide repeat domain-containing protein n=1 Tax=Cudoniella acicularis TaxID=354080 RepID=A0A8H4W009_9HELO|nr:hypothetical protein G7Y89_g9536 [Cudoniella acicularis]